MILVTYVVICCVYKGLQSTISFLENKFLIFLSFLSCSLMCLGFSRKLKFVGKMCQMFLLYFILLDDPLSLSA